MTASAQTVCIPHHEEPIAVTLAELLGVLAEITDDEDEIVATLLHMVEGGRVRLIGERAEAL